METGPLRPPFRQTDQEDFLGRSTRSPPLNASHGAGRQNGRHPQRPNTGGSRGSQQVPYLLRFSGPKCCSPLTSGATSNAGLLLSGCCDAGLDRGRDGPPNSVAGSKQPQQSSHAACSSHSGEFCDRRAVVMAQHETSLCFFSCLTTSTGHRLINGDNVQPRRVFVDSLLTPC